MKIQLLLIALLALTVAACTTTDGRYDNGRRSDYRSERSYDQDRGHRDDRSDRDNRRCNDCGVVERIEGYSERRRASGGGAVAGAVIGGLLGNQVGSGDGKTAATIAGAVGGGFAGNAIEKNAKHRYYDLSIRMDNGRRVVVTQRNLHGVREGSRVTLRNGEARLD